MWRLFSVLLLVQFSLAKTIAVKDVESDQLSLVEKSSLANYITSEMSGKYPTDKVIAWGDVKEMLKHLTQVEETSVLATNDSAMRCNTEKCYAELGGTLGIDEILTVDLSKLGSSYLINMRLIDINRAATAGRSSRKVSGGVDEILDVVPAMLSELAGQKPDPKVEATKIQAKKDSLAQVQQMEQKARLDAERQAQMTAQNQAAQKLKEEQARQLALELKAKADEEARLDQGDPNRHIRKWLRIGGAGLASAGLVYAYLGYDKGQKASDAYDKARLPLVQKTEWDKVQAAKSQTNLGLGVLVLGLGCIGASFAF